jgi:hypothetical protein
MEIKDFSFFSLSKKETEIMEFIDPGSKHIYDGVMVVSFVISNPPKNKDSLLSLVSKHFQSFVQNDTIEKYRYYIHEYYKETRLTRHDYIEKRERYSFYLDYLYHRRKDLLVTITVEPKYNKQVIGFYRKGLNVDKGIKKMWRKQ